MTDWDDPLDDRRAELDARFRELEQQEELDRIRQGKAPSARAETGEAPMEEDDLADLKASLEEETLFVLLLCPKCGAKNRTDLSKLRQLLPKCGGCNSRLSFTR